MTAMTELDALQLAREARTLELNDGAIVTDLDSEEMTVIIAALKDYEQLQAAVIGAIAHTSIAPEDVEAEPLPYMWISKKAIEKLQAALEGHDG